MTMPADPLDQGELDVAIVGAGAAGTYLGYRLVEGALETTTTVADRLRATRQ